MQLTRQQKLQFHRDGYLKIPGAVPLIMIDGELIGGYTELAGALRKGDISLP